MIGLVCGLAAGAAILVLALFLALREARARGRAEALRAQSLAAEEAQRDAIALLSTPLPSRDELLERMRTGP